MPQAIRLSHRDILDGQAQTALKLFWTGAVEPQAGRPALVMDDLEKHLMNLEHA